MTVAVGIEQIFHGQYNRFLSKRLEFKPLNLFIHSGSLHIGDCKKKDVKTYCNYNVEHKIKCKMI